MRIKERKQKLIDKQVELSYQQVQLSQVLVQLEKIHYAKKGKSNKSKIIVVKQIFKVLYWTITFQLTNRLKRREIAHLIGESGLFDTNYYYSQNLDVKETGADPLGHYLDVGASQMREPNLLFDTAYYLKNNPDVMASGMNPLAHYIKIGTLERKNPHPLFDTEYYLKNNPDVMVSGMNPLAHYIQIGALERKNPHPLFDTEYYLKNNPDVMVSGMNPLAHYIKIGALERKNSHSLFDTEYYLKNNPDVILSGLNPLIHYIKIGALERKNPHPLFDTEYYLKNNPDVILSGLNPLIHYLKIAENIPIVSANLIDLIEILTQTELSLSLQDEASQIYFPYYNQPQVSIIIPVYNQLNYTLRCLKGLTKQSTNLSFEVIVVDDCSTDETEKTLQLVKGLNYLKNQENKGFLQSGNLASQKARGDFLVFLNKDTISLANWLTELIEPFLIQEKVGLVGSMLIYPNGRLQEAGGLIWSDGSGCNFGRGGNPDACEYNFVRETDYCSGASIAITSKLWQELQGFDPIYSPAYYEDTDLAFRIRQAGYKVIYTPFSNGSSPTK